MVKSIHVLSDSTVVVGIYPKGVIFYHPNGHYQTIVTKDMMPVWDIEPTFESNDEYFVVTNNKIYLFNKTTCKGTKRTSTNEDYYILHKGIDSYFLCYTEIHDEYSQTIIEELTKEFKTFRKFKVDKYVTSLLQKDNDNLLVSTIDGVWCYQLNNLSVKRILKERAQSIM